MSYEKANDARNRAVEELRAMYEAAGDEALSAEDSVKEARLEDDIQSLGKRAQNLALMAQAEERNAAASNELASLEAPVVEAREERRDIAAELRSGGSNSSVQLPSFFEARDAVNVNITTGSDGPELVAEELSMNLHELMVDHSVIMQLATVFSTPGGNDIKVPRFTSYSAAALIAEAASVGTDSPQWDQVTFSAYKFGFMVPVTSEADADMQFNVGNIVASQGAAALGRGLDAEFVSGAGTTRPDGIDLGSTGMTTAATGAVTTDELIEAQHSVLASQRGRGSWLFHDDTIQAIRKLKGSDGQYLWQASTQAGVPDMLLGAPVYVEPNLAVMATGADFGIFGDLSGFHVRLAGGIRIDRSVDSSFANDLIDYRFLQRADSKLIDTTGIRVLTNA